MHIAIVEDDARLQEELRQYVIRYFAGRENQCRISVFSDGDEILENYSAAYDLIFLDIQMQRLDGMQTAERIRELDAEVYLIFITNLGSYAIQGYSVNALDFVLKPVNFLMLKQLLQRVEKLLAGKQKKYIPLPTARGMTRLDISLIHYIETDGHAVHIYTEDGDWRVRESMKNMETKLAEYGFYRCNSCYLVNLAHVEQVDGSEVVVAGHPLSISRPRYKAFMSTLTRYIGGMKA